MVNPAGSALVSVQPFLAASSEVLVIVIVSVEVPPGAIAVGLNDWSTCGVASRTRMLSKAKSLPVLLTVALVIRIPRAEPANRSAPLAM